MSPAGIFCQKPNHVFDRYIFTKSENRFCEAGITNTASIVKCRQYCLTQLYDMYQISR